MQKYLRFLPARHGNFLLVDNDLWYLPHEQYGTSKLEEDTKSLPIATDTEIDVNIAEHTILQIQVAVTERQFNCAPVTEEEMEACLHWWSVQTFSTKHTKHANILGIVRSGVWAKWRQAGGRDKVISAVWNMKVAEATGGIQVQA